jgi:BirA family biotin operon repressor/biotin-[acetyl-CoA-carboxylase] ligase
MNERDLLVRLADGPASGAELAREAGQTRAAVWKHIEALRMAGVGIAVLPGRGYALAHPLALLDADAILAALSPGARGQLASLEVAWTIDSTNSALLARETPAAGAAVLLAERQTGGRGRRGRAWASPLAANVYLSLARHFSGGLARLAGLSLVAGVAAAESLQALGFDGVRLKWPNDLVVDAPGGLRKLGGLLVEGGGEGGGAARAVVGFGLNVAMPAAQAAAIDQPWADLAGLAGGVAPSRNDVVAALLDRWLPAFDAFDAEGLAPFLPRYARLDALAGRAVRVHSADGARDGLALGLAADGSLQVRGADGNAFAVHAGDVSVRAA